MDSNGGCQADATDGSGCISVANMQSNVVEEDEEEDEVCAVRYYTLST